MNITKTGMEQANADEVEAIERQRLKEKLLRSLENPKSISSGSTSTEDALRRIRLQGFNRLITGRKLRADK